jgi:hypothetical protein
MTMPSRRFLIQQAILNAAAHRVEIFTAHRFQFVSGPFHRAIIVEFNKLVASFESFETGELRI